MIDNIRNFLSNLGLSEGQVGLALQLAALAGVAILSILANFVAKKIIVRAVHLIVRRTRTTWDDVLQERKVFTRLSHLAPALVIWYLAPEVLGKTTDESRHANPGEGGAEGAADPASALARRDAPQRYVRVERGRCPQTP